MKDMIRSAIAAAVNTVTNKSDTVKADVVQHLHETMFSGEQVENTAQEIIKIILNLSEQFEKLSLNDSRLITYLLENLDLPRSNLQEDAIDDLIHLGNQADNLQNDDTVAVVPSKAGLTTLPNHGVVLKRVDPANKDSEITHTMAYVKLSASKMFLFVLTKGINSYVVKTSGENLLVEKLENFTTQDLGRALEEIKDTEFAPPLISDREVFVIEDLDTDWMDAYLEDHPDTITSLGEKNPQIVLDTLVRKFVELNELEVSDKRLEIVHMDELMARIYSILNESETPQVEVEEDVEQDVKTLAAPDDDIEVAEVVEDEDASLFTEGVTEQTQETVTPNDTDVVDLFEEEGTDEPNYESKDTQEIAVELLLKLGENPKLGLETIQNSNLTIKDSLYREVFNNLPTIQKRSSSSYTDSEKQEVTDALDKVYRDVLKQIEDYRTQVEKKRLEALPYKAEMVSDYLSTHPVHSVMVESAVARVSIAEAVSRYLNDNTRESNPDEKHEEHISEVIRNISLYGYETEAIINGTYRATNVPSKENLIRHTPVISTTLRKMYKSVNAWESKEADLLKSTFNDVFSNKLSGLDIDNTIVEILMSGKLNTGEFTRAGSYIVARVPVKYTGGACIIVMSASQARVFNIVSDDLRVVGVTEVTTPMHRGDLLNLLMYR